MKTYDITIRLSLVDMDPKKGNESPFATEVVETVAAVTKRLGDKATVAVSAPWIEVIDLDTLPRQACACGK